MKLAELAAHELILPRNAFSPRETARAGDVWRACQDVAVRESIRVGWPPSRYRDEGTSFVVREMTVVHHRETTYGEALLARTWVSRFRRELLSTREVRIFAGAVPVASATQEWVHVAADLRPTRAEGTLLSAFPTLTIESELSVELPQFTSVNCSSHVFGFSAWQTWMDPLAHANHPAYVDYCDEALARVVVRAGLSPHAIVPVAESALFRSGVVAGEDVRVESKLTGRAANGAVVVVHRVMVGERRCADVTTVRTLASGDGEELARAVSL